MLLAKTLTVPVELVVKPASDVTHTQKPFFDPGASTSNLPVENSLPVEKSGPYLDQATGIAVEEMQTATQPLGVPGAGIATQPVQAPGSFPEVQPTGEVDLSAASEVKLTSAAKPVPWMVTSTGTGQQTRMPPKMTLRLNPLRRLTTGKP